MKADSEGFLYPSVTAEACTECGICETVCPALQPEKAALPRDVVFAAKAKSDKLRKESSSGGVFGVLAEKILSEGGVVFAAKFDRAFHLSHSACRHVEDLQAYKGSKYLQSDMGNCYKEVRDALSTSCKVLFVGTPCQVMGLKLFLAKPFANLITMEVVCHGVPSPKVFAKYLDETCKRKDIAPRELDSISFRSKDISWGFFSMKFRARGKTVYRATLHKDPFLRVFLKNLDLRPSCGNCPAKNFASDSDITAGDYWGVGSFHPYMDDFGGVSALILKDKSLVSLFDKRKIELERSKYRYVLKQNPALEHSAKHHPDRDEYMRRVFTEGFYRATAPYLKNDFSKNLKRNLRQVLSKVKRFVLRLLGVSAKKR